MLEQVAQTLCIPSWCLWFLHAHCLDMLHLSVELSGVTTEKENVAFFLPNLSVFYWGITNIIRSVSSSLVLGKIISLSVGWLFSGHQVWKSLSVVAPHVPVDYGKLPVLLAVTRFSAPAVAEDFSKIQEWSRKVVLPWASKLGKRKHNLLEAPSQSWFCARMFLGRSESWAAPKADGACEEWD